MNCLICGSSNVKNNKNIIRNYQRNEYKLNLNKCNNCDFIFLNNPPVLEYDYEYLQAEGVITLESRFAKFHAIERIKNISSLIKEGKFLDFGIGDGLILRIAEDYGFDTYGVDINPVGVELARKTYGIKAKISLDKIESAFPADLFDIIHLNEVIEHLNFPMEILKSCYKRLNKNGIIVIQTGNIDSMVSKIKGDSWDYIRPVHVNYFSQQTLQKSLRIAGFDVIKKSTIDWSFIDTIKYIAMLFSKEGLTVAINFSLLYLTAIIPQVRRSTLQIGKKSLQTD